MSGWIKVHRDINQHWIWQDNNYLKWWLDILLEVNHTEGEIVIKGTILKCGRGEKLYSLDTWANRWNTNKSKVNRFLKMLEKQNMISLKSETHTTRLKVCKYDDYQDKDSKSETQVKRKRNASETQVKSIQERKERIEYKEEDSLMVSENPYIDFDALLAFFNKVTGKKIKSIIPKAKKQFLDRIKDGYSKEDIAKAIVNCKNDRYHIENPKYLTPEFISRPDKFEKYFSLQLSKVNLPDDWVHRELTQEQKSLLTEEQLKQWNRNKTKIEVEGGRLRQIEK